MSEKKVRTRFAPSPTGYLHVGGVRTALFAWLVAKQAGGQFILRIEDTDRSRHVEESEQHIIKSLKWLGIKSDEEPVRQSQRLDIYKKWAHKLIEAGRAYADPSSPDQLEELRQKAKEQKRPFLFRDHRPDNPPAWDGSIPLRFKSEPKDYKWHDEVMGELSAGPEAIDDFIIIKSDGFPTYNFAHIVDDYEMNISHVIRSQEFLPSVPRFLNLYEALGLEEPAEASQADAVQGGGENRSEPYGQYGERESELPTQQRAASTSGVAGSAGKQASAVRRFRPKLATLPYVMSPDGQKKLSKRDGAKDILDYRREGYLPEALINFLATLGWNDGTEQEIFSVDELIKKFNLSRVQRSGACFDEQRLLWMNGHYIRQLPLDELYNKAEDFWPNEAKAVDESYKKAVLGLVQERLKYLAELAQLTQFFFAEPDTSSVAKLYEHPVDKQLQKNPPDYKNFLEAVIEELSGSDFSVPDIQTRLNKLLKSLGTKPAILFPVIRIAATGSQVSPEIFGTLHVLGKEKSLQRLKKALQSLE